MNSDVASLVTSVTLEPDPLDENSTDLAIQTTLPPGAYEGDQSVMAVGLAASACGYEQLHVGLWVYDRDGKAFGQ